jgi:hypothetical protein
MLLARRPVPEGSSLLDARGERAAEVPFGTEDDAARLGGSSANTYLDRTIWPPAGRSSNVLENGDRRVDDVDAELELTRFARRDRGSLAR